MAKSASIGACKVISPGNADIKVAALTDEESDAMQMSFPVYIHGMLKTDSFSRRDAAGRRTATLGFHGSRRASARAEPGGDPLFAERGVGDGRCAAVPGGLSVRVHGADAEPVSADGHHAESSAGDESGPEGRSRRSEPTSTRRRSATMPQRAKDWKRNNPPNPGRRRAIPVFDEAIGARHDRARESNAWPTCRFRMAGGDGSAASAKQSWPHTTALVVHGLQIAKSNGVVLPGDMLERGQKWLARLPDPAGADAAGTRRRRSSRGRRKPTISTRLSTWCSPTRASSDGDMMEFLYRDRNEIAVYGKAMFGNCSGEAGEKEKLEMILQNISQYVVQDNENQTAYLKLPAENYWWCWYGSDTEAMGYYLKLLSRTDPHGDVAAGSRNISSTIASTPPTGTARATRRSALRPWPTTSRPAAKTSRTRPWRSARRQEDEGSSHRRHQPLHRSTTRWC